MGSDLSTGSAYLRVYMVDLLRHLHYRYINCKEDIYKERCSNFSFGFTFTGSIEEQRRFTFEDLYSDEF